jgi:hypothetical protein
MHPTANIGINTAPAQNLRLAQRQSGRTPASKKC